MKALNTKYPILNTSKVVLIFFLCISISGCGSQWKRKFVRKKNAEQAEQVFVYEPQEYQRESNAELYKRSFIFWKAWQRELVDRLGNSRPADLRSFEEALKNLDEMKNCLNDQKTSALDGYIKKMGSYYETYKSEEPDIIRSRQMRQDLDRLLLKIDKEFRYKRVLNLIK